MFISNQLYIALDVLKYHPKNVIKLYLCVYIKLLYFTSAFPNHILKPEQSVFSITYVGMFNIFRMLFRN